jgi:DNA repair protein RAD50
MEEINKSINDTWQAIYDGDDIRRIFIKSDEDTQSSKRTTKSYFYRIVMESKSGVEMDMRGRSSMGQKVLASIVIRLALSESFGNQCSVLALDEPTTNLDRVHILSSLFIYIQNWPMP